MKKEVENKVCSIYPCPNLIVSCRDKDGKNNALVVGFAGNVSLDPPMVMVGIVPDRFSHHMVKEMGAFVINVSAQNFKEEYSCFGGKSGRDMDKFEALKIRWENGEKVDAPLLLDCPVNIECKVVTSLQPGTHELFIATVEAVHCDEQYIGDNGSIDWGKIPLL